MDWLSWQQIVVQRASILRVPQFGDYGIAHPIMAELDPRTMVMSANLRYTADDYWLVLKKRNVNKHGYSQFIDICRDLVKLQEYSGRSFSWGDQQIADYAAGNGGPGNAQMWRKIGTNHHLTKTIKQVASQPFP